MRKFNVKVDYTLLGKLENELRNSDFLLEEIEYLDNVFFHVRVHIGEEDTFLNWITNLTSGSAEIKEGEESYLEVDVSAH